MRSFLWWFMHLFDMYLALESGVHSPEQIIHPLGHALIHSVVHALIRRVSRPRVRFAQS